jgi:hypothetical protein
LFLFAFARLSFYHFGTVATIAPINLAYQSPAKNILFLTVDLLLKDRALCKEHNSGILHIMYRCLTALGARGVGWAAPAPRLARNVSFSTARARERRAGLHLLYTAWRFRDRGVPGDGDERLEQTSV